MYQIYIKNFNRSGSSSPIASETLMLQIPGSNFPIDKPIVKGNEDAADTFSFSMNSNSVYYAALIPLQTMIRVVYDGVTIFYGRVLTISTSTVYHTKSITCSGTYEFLNDTYYEGKQESSISKIPLAVAALNEYSSSKTYSVGDHVQYNGSAWRCTNAISSAQSWTASNWKKVTTYLEKIIDNHNAQAESAKKINIGTVGNFMTSKVDKYEPTSWSQSMSLMSSLTNEYGGHMKIRYSGTSSYLDWYKYYAHDYANDANSTGRPVVEIGRNILDISSQSGVDNLFTRLIPIGASGSNGKNTYLNGYTYKDKNGTSHTIPNDQKYIDVGIVNEIYSDSKLNDEFHNATDYSNAVNNFGYIYKTVSFPSAKTQKALFEEAYKWIKDCYFGFVTSFTVKAIDMHILDGSSPKITLGECVNVKYWITNINGGLTQETRKLVCKAVQYDLFNPENNSYTFGIPSDLLDKNKQNRKSSKTASNYSAPAPSSGPNTDRNDVSWINIARMIAEEPAGFNSDYQGTDAYLSFYENGELSGTITAYDPEEIPEGKTYLDIKDKWFTGQIVGKIKLEGRAPKYVAVSSERGIFGYMATGGDAVMVRYWYSKKSNIIYTPQGTGLSNFDTIANYIRQDTSETYGGDDNANSFIQNGRMSGSVKCYDPEQNVVVDAETNQTTELQELAPPFDDTTRKYIFNAEIVGKFGTSGNVKYVAISSEYGIFAYTHMDYPDRVRHWYYRAKGLTYDNISGLLTTDSASSDLQIITCNNNGNGHGKTDGDLGSTYTASNGTKWSIEGIRSASMLVLSRTSGTASLPTGGGVSNRTLTHKKGGIHTASIVYDSVQNYGREIDLVDSSGKKRTITCEDAHGKTASDDVGSIYISNENSSRWQISKVISTVTLELYFVSGDSENFPPSGTLRHSSGGTHTGNIVYGSTKVIENRAIALMPTLLTQDGSTGAAVFGYDLTGDEDKWRIKLNVPVQYADANGSIHIADGFVSASDFHVDTIPSFKTKLGVFDLILAGKVSAVEIEAERAYLNHLRGDSISTGVYVRSQYVYARGVYADDFKFRGVNGEEGASLKGAFHNCLAETNSTTGEVTLTFFSFMNGTAGQQKVTFNRATTIINLTDTYSSGGENEGPSLLVSSTPSPVRSFKYYFTIINSNVLGRKLSISRYNENEQLQTVGQIDLTDVYRSGWSNAYAKLEFPTETSDGTTLTVSGPSSTVDSESPKQQVYTLCVTGISATHTYTATLATRNANGSVVTVAKADASYIWNDAIASISLTMDYTSTSDTGGELRVSSGNDTIGDKVAYITHVHVGNTNSVAISERDQHGNLNRIGTISLPDDSDGGYSEGWQAARNSVSFPVSSGSSSSITFQRPSPVVDGTSPETKTYTLELYGTAYVNLNTVNDSGSTITVARLSVTTVRSEGWLSAGNSVTLPASIATSTIKTSASLSVPNKTVAYNTTTHNLAIVKEGLGDSTNVIFTIGGTPRLRISVGSLYTSGYNAGGATAKLSNTGTNGTITLGYGGSTSITAQYVDHDGTTKSTSSTVTVVAPNAPSVSISGSWNSAGKYSVSATAGSASNSTSTTISIGGTWSNGTYTAKVTESGKTTTILSTTTQLTAASASWSGNTATRQIQYTTSSGNQNTGYSVTVDATERYKAGYNAGGATAKLSNTGTNGTITLGYGGATNITAQYVDYSGTTHNTSSTVRITAPADRYNDGYDDGLSSINANSITMWSGHAPTYVAATTSHPAGQYTVKYTITKTYKIKVGSDGSHKISNNVGTSSLLTFDATDAYNAGKAAAGLGSSSLASSILDSKPGSGTDSSALKNSINSVKTGQINGKYLRLQITVKNDAGTKSKIYTYYCKI